MIFSDQITVMIITYNEEANIARTLDAVKWAKQILIVDSGSTDATLGIARQHHNVEVVYRAFDDFANQCNFGLSLIKSEWVLSIDADYELTPELTAEIGVLEPSETKGYSCRFIYQMYGRPLRASLYPPRTVLYRREDASYHNEGHGHRVSVTGPVATLNSTINHCDYKPLSRWLASQQRYARLEADHLLDAQEENLRRVDRLRRMGWPAPLLVFIYTLVWKRCVFDGWPGWLYVLQRTAAETIIALEIIDRRVRNRHSLLSDGPGQ